MRLSSSILFVAALLACLAMSCATKTGQAAPDWSLRDEKGAIRAMHDYDGTVRLMYFWATWCAPCGPVGKRVEEIHQEFSGRGLETLAVHYDDTGAPLDYAREHGYTFTIFPSGNSVAKLYDVSKIPTILVVDRDGVVVYRMTGFEDEVLGGLERFVVQQLRDPPGG